MESNNYKKISLPINDDSIKPTNPDFKWLGWTLGAIAGIFLLAYISFSAFSYIVVANIDEKMEKEIFGELGLYDFEGEPLDISQYTLQFSEFEDYNFFVIHSDEYDQANAFAFIGGAIGITEKLLEEVTSEEELFFILAHEIGHAKKRHNINRLSRDIPLFMTLSFLGLDFNLGVASSNSLLSNVHSRSAEKEGDDYAIQLFQKYNLNINCATPFFEDSLSIPGALSTHPSNTERIEKMRNSSNSDEKCHTI